MNTQSLLRATRSPLGARALAATVAAGAVLAASSAQTYERWIDIANYGDCPIVLLQISHVDTNDWGGDLLGSGVIPAGDTVRVEPRHPRGYCRFDVLLTFADGTEQAIWDVNLCEATDLVADGWGYDVTYS